MGEVDLRLVAGSLQELEARRLHASVRARLFGDDASTWVAGRYRIDRRIGEGGMGVVYRAHDRELDRDVALKVVNPTSLSSAGPEVAQQALLTEARTMARVADPRVVEVYDVTRLDDTVFIVMELCPGTQLRSWLELAPLTWRRVVDTFIEAGRGLAAAHRVGIVHRDFKPSNVMVEPSGRVRVLDFGLAGIAQSDLSSEGSFRSVDAFGPTLHASSDTTKGGRVVGTPPYMAPEQHAGAEPTPATDQFALCAALWEALHGALPYAATSYLSLMKAKLDGPPRWSMGNRASLAKAVPRRIVAAIERGLSPSPQDRWPSMPALLDALAWGPNRRRTRVLVAVGGIAVAVAASISRGPPPCSGADERLADAWNDDTRARAKTAILAIDKPYAQTVAERSLHELDQYASRWEAMHLAACEAATVRREQSMSTLDLRMACMQRAIIELKAVGAELTDADDVLARRAHELIAELPPLSRCADIDALAQDVEPPLPEEAAAVETVYALLAGAKANLHAARLALAQEKIEAARQAARAITYGPLQTDLARSEGDLLQDLGDLDAATAAYRRALRSALRWRQKPLVALSAVGLMFSLGNKQDRIGPGMAYARIAAANVAAPHYAAVYHDTLASVLYARGDYSDAEAEYRRAIELRERSQGADHLDIAGTRNNLGGALLAQGKFDAAEIELRSALAKQVEELGPDHPLVASSWGNIGILLGERGRFADAEAAYRKALDLHVAALGPDHPAVAGALNNLGDALLQQGEFEEAEVAHRRALAVWQHRTGFEVDVAMSRANIGNTLLMRERYAEAEAEYRDALLGFEEALGPDNPRVGMLRVELADSLRMQRKSEEAEAQFRRGLELLERALPPEHPQLAMSRSRFAGFLLEQDDPRQARALVERAWRPRYAGVLPPQVWAEMTFALARARWETEPSRDERARARQLAAQAVAAYEEAGDQYAGSIGQIRDWLGTGGR